MIAKPIDLSRLPAIFLAYPGHAQMKHSMPALADEMRERGANAITWQSLTNPGFLFEPIGKAIDQSGLVIADTTHGNANVLFEVGYAIARGKRVLLLKDENVRDPVSMPPLELVRHVDYTTRSDIVRYLADVDLSGPTLLDQLGRQGDHEDHAGLYFVPSRRGGDFNNTALQVCRDGPFLVRMMDTWETDFDSLASQTSSIRDADVFVTLLVSKNTRDYWYNNAEAMLFAGLATGFEKDLVVLIHEPYRRLVDIGERLIRFETEPQLEMQLRRWITSAASTRLRSPRPAATIAAPRQSPLTGLFMGNRDARADFDLGAYFIETPEFKQAEAAQRHLFAGAKGSGKTANFEILQERLANRSLVLLAIAPADFEFPRLASVFEEHLSLARWEFVYGSFWRFILYTEVLRAIQLKFLGHLIQYAGEGKEYAQVLLGWIDENQDLLGLDFVSRVDAVLDRIASTSLGDPESRREALEELLQSARMYRIDPQLREFSRQFEIRLLIDDLDRNWSPDNPSSARLIVTLLNEIHTLMTTQAGHLRPAIFLRRDVFRWLELNDPEGHVPSSGVKARQPHNWVNQKPSPVAPPPSARRSSRWRPSRVPMRR